MTTSSGTPILLVTRGLTNNAGAAGLQPGAGRFLVCSVDPANDQTGGLAGEVRFNSSFASVPPDSPALTAGTNFFLYEVSPPPSDGGGGGGNGGGGQPNAEQELQRIPPSVVNPSVTDVGGGPSILASLAAAATTDVVATAPAQPQLLPQAPRVWGEKDEDLLYSNDGNRDLWGIAGTPMPAPTN